MYNATALRRKSNREVTKARCAGRSDVRKHTDTEGSCTDRQQIEQTELTQSMNMQTNSCSNCVLFVHQWGLETVADQYTVSDSCPLLFLCQTVICESWTEMAFAHAGPAITIRLKVKAP